MKVKPRERISPCSAVLLAAELGLVLTTMSLLCCAYPERVRRTLWQIGGENGWNSNPRLRVYFYANYEKPPDIPPIWSQRLSESNLAISVLAVVISMVRIVLAFLGSASSFSAVFNAFNDMLLSGFWMYSVAAQSSSDLTDPGHLSLRPWYLEKSCEILHESVVHHCVLAKACFAFSVLSLMLFLARSVYSVLKLAYWCGSRQMLDRGVAVILVHSRLKRGLEASHASPLFSIRSNHYDYDYDDDDDDGGEDVNSCDEHCSRTKNSVFWVWHNNDDESWGPPRGE
ncbi:hypothetical protein GGS23DRAFT_570477 [Durotheca rogersii]|uniref:uncharacterized protein n=1 Tax=Durotheca rogersii TaxID=419775 RepID=UPI00221EDBE3|nr:uncharacterized protein GGS23DRAFT_570477 [Durotheca rogersii]KAI5862496.1 hypothetical protein GGS23DRAFT_570477 [Durotheca rogersii]